MHLPDVKGKAKQKKERDLFASCGRPGKRAKEDLQGQSPNSFSLSPSVAASSTMYEPTGSHLVGAIHPVPTYSTYTQAPYPGQLTYAALPGTQPLSTLQSAGGSSSNLSGENITDLDSLKALTVNQLKDVCRFYHLQVGGNKGDLISRLFELSKC
ncbi:hypothetical protein NMY22_g19331 [Coprinellus aureogranulatus]|nr:hypothetical protein NMY22_g19331 [Coprinellus aureogranulatus]